MKNLLIIFFTTALLLIQVITAQPKHEFRAAWIATVLGLDWPDSYSVSSQQTQLINILEGMEQANMNVAVFQVRPACDVFYDSDIEPWSNWLTGTEGQAPDPYYDPLKFAVEEAHKKNIELHAWFNPYRAKEGSDNGVTAEHVYNAHPDWILSVSGKGNVGFTEAGWPLQKNTTSTDYILNPGLPEVRDYVLSVIMEAVNNFDIDGVHMDDYFYPYNGISNEDQESFQNHSRGFTNIHDWRRDNINILLQAINDSINIVKPHVKFGMSPFGIWKNGVPEGIVGLDAYSVIYCDAVAWLQGQYIDYLTPQLYWEFGGGQDYAKLMPWWATKVKNNDRHLYTGNAAYRITTHDWNANQLPRQIELNRATDGCRGNVYFRINHGVLNNPKGFLDSLETNFYKYPALTPKMTWKDSITALPPENVTLIEEDSLFEISWQQSAIAADGDTASRYVLYHSFCNPVDISDPENIFQIIAGKDSSITITGLDDGFLCITALDRLNNESEAVVIGETLLDPDLTNLGNKFELQQNYPNPFNPSTTIPFFLNKKQTVILKIFNLTGQEVAVLIDNRVMRMGEYKVDFDAGNLPTGIYFYQIIAGSTIGTEKMVFVK